MLCFIHSGQTGVERGAFRAAHHAGIAVTGFSTVDERDELGPLPDAVRETLTPCRDRGSRAAVRANLEIASGLIIFVPDRQAALGVTGMRVLVTLARGRGVRYMAADPATSSEEIAVFVAALPETSGSVRVMITGPRRTRWNSGERSAWLALAMLEPC